MKNKVIIILGPTAAGKTEWGILLARKYKGEIICADSRTVYKYFNIATAKPTESQMQGVKHHLIDFIDPRKKVYTVAEFQRDAIKAIKDIIKRGKLPFIVGGSPLYIYALTRGYHFSGKGDKRLRRELEGKELAELQAMAKKIKNLSINASDFQNKRRLIRAIEVFKNCKLKIENCRFSPLPYSFLKIGISMPREEVYQRIDMRTKKWLREGLINEAKQLLKKGIGPKIISEFGLGYKEVLKYLYGEIKSKKELEERINYTQHAFVRRQMNWFRKDKEIVWFTNISDAEGNIKKFLSTA